MADPPEQLIPIPGVYGAYRYQPEQTLVATTTGYLVDASEVPPQEPVLSFSLPFEKLYPVEDVPDRLILARPMRLDLEVRRGDSAYWEMELWADDERTIPIDILTLFPELEGKPLWVAITGQIRPNYGTVAWATMTGDLIPVVPTPTPPVPSHEIWINLTAEESDLIPITATIGVWDVQTVQYEMQTLEDWYDDGNTEPPPDFPPTSTGEGPWLHEEDGVQLVLLGRPGVRTVVGGEVVITKDVTRVGLPA